MNRTFLALFTLLAGTALPAAAQPWSMTSCIKYAQENNLSIKDDEINTRLATLNLRQSRLSQLPSVNGAASTGVSASNVADANGGYTGQNFSFTSFVGTADVLVFGWFAKRNNIRKNLFASQAADADHDQLKQDVSLNVATGYLRALLAKERIGISQKQMDLTRVQLNDARIQVRAGTAAELGAVLLQSQLATDSATYLSAVSIYNSAILDLKALLALSASTPLDIVDPEAAMKSPVSMESMESVQAIYETAARKLGKMRAYDYSVRESEKQWRIAQALRYPRLSLVSQLSTIYTTIGKNYSLAGYSNVAVPATYIDVNGTQYPVYQSTPSYDVQKASFSDQLSRNFTGVYALSLNLPLFNGLRGQYTSRSTNLTMQSQKIKRSVATLDLRNEVYKAYDQVTLAAQRFNAARSSAEAAQSALYFASQRMSSGLLTTIEYLQVQNSVNSVKEQLLAAKYEYILKVKIIDYYMGKDLAL